MKQADNLLLNALKAAIHNEKAALGVLPQETQTELLRQAVRHGVLPLVLDACGKALKAARQMAFCQTAEQILKTQVLFRQLCASTPVSPSVMKMAIIQSSRIWHNTPIRYRCSKLLIKQQATEFWLMAIYKQSQ